jgi:hypothetical protein
MRLEPKGCLKPVWTGNDSQTAAYFLPNRENPEPSAVGSQFANIISVLNLNLTERMTPQQHRFSGNPIKF